MGGLVGLAAILGSGALSGLILLLGNVLRPDVTPESPPSSPPITIINNNDVKITVVVESTTVECERLLYFLPRNCVRTTILNIDGKEYRQTQQVDRKGNPVNEDNNEDNPVTINANGE